MIWGGILGSEGKKVLVIWEKDDWGTITAQTYINHILVPALYPFWVRESSANGPGEPLMIMEDGAPAHRAEATRAWQQ